MAIEADSRLRYHFTIYGMSDGSKDRVGVTLERCPASPTAPNSIRLAVPSERYQRLIDLLEIQTNARFHGNNQAYRYHTRELGAFLKKFAVDNPERARGV